MSLDRTTINKIKRFAQAFKDARDRGANESDTVMFLVKFFEEVMGFDSLAGEISKEVCVKDRYCDFGIKLNGTIRYLVEAKAAGNKSLREKDIEQAENYASRAGIRWVLLTNGIEWQLYHLTFNEGEGIAHDLAFEFNLAEHLEESSERIGGYLSLINRTGLEENSLETFWEQKKTLSPASLVRVMFTEPVLNVLRRELNRTSEVRLEMADVFNAVKDALSKDALMAAGDITLKKKRRKRRKVSKVDSVTGQTTEVEEETDEEEDEIASPQAIAEANPVEPSTPPPPTNQSTSS